MSCVRVATRPGLCPLAQETASAAPTLCVEYGPNGWVNMCCYNVQIDIHSHPFCLFPPPNIWLCFWFFSSVSVSMFLFKSTHKTLRHKIPRRNEQVLSSKLRCRNSSQIKSPQEARGILVTHVVFTHMATWILH